jgi:hypothetical protein
MSAAKHVQPVRLSPELFNTIVDLAKNESRPVAQMTRVLIERGLGMTELSNAQSSKDFERIWRTHVGRAVENLAVNPKWVGEDRAAQARKARGRD